MITTTLITLTTVSLLTGSPDIATLPVIEKCEQFIVAESYSATLLDSERVFSRHNTPYIPKEIICQVRYRWVVSDSGFT